MENKQSTSNTNARGNPGVITVPDQAEAMGKMAENIAKHIPEGMMNKAMKNGLIGHVETVPYNKAEFLLQKALTQKPVHKHEPVKIKTCVEEYGKHDWEVHEETKVEFCKHCKLRKDRWEPTEGEIPDNNGNIKGTEEYKVGYKKPPLDTRIKPGEVRNPLGRPKVVSVTDMFRQTLQSKVYTIRDESTGVVTQINGYQALVEKILESGIKKGNHKDLKMVWEMLDGKPTQQHKIEINGPKGYIIDPNREKLIHKQFGLYEGVIVEPQTPQNEPRDAKVTDTTTLPAKAPNAPQVAKEPAKTIVTKPNGTNPTTNNKPTPAPTGVQETPKSVGGGVTEA